MLIAFLVSQLVKRLRSIDFKKELRRIWAAISEYSRKLGLITTRELLTLYYALSEGDLTPKEKAFTYAAIAYVLIPGDLLPRKVLGLLGITDDATALIFALRKIRKHRNGLLNVVYALSHKKVLRASLSLRARQQTRLGNVPDLDNFLAFVIGAPAKATLFADSIATTHLRFVTNGANATAFLGNNDRGFF